MNIITSFLILEGVGEGTLEDVVEQYGLDTVSKVHFIVYQNVKGSGKYRVLKDKITHSLAGQDITEKRLVTLL